MKPSLWRVATVVAVLSLCAVAHAAPKYKLLANFAGTDGSGPYGGVVIDQEGNVYGTTVGGGTGSCRGGCGIVFQLSPGENGGWAETVVHTFNFNDGADPQGGVIFDPFGNLYGTTIGGGGPYKYGTVFELKPSAHGWIETLLHRFGVHDKVAAPHAGVARDQAGNLYGTTPYGIFELRSSSNGWSETVLHLFGIRKGDGAGPFAGLILDAAGNLYGTTAAGGMGCAGEGCGTVYEIKRTSNGWKEAVLHRFDNNGKDGGTPGNGALMMDGLGNLFGTTEGGGCCGGIVFELTPGSNGHWKETILYNFKPGATGSFPTAGVVMDKAGNLYGTTADGGSASCGCGVIYKLAPSKNGKWTYTVLHRFSGADGAIPAGNLILDDKGNLYGGTVLGGSTNNGVIFELTP